MNNKLKVIVLKFSPIINILPFYNQIHLNGCKLSLKNAFLRKTSINCHGKNNSIIIRGKLVKCHIHINGDNNLIIINEDTQITEGSFSLSGNDNKIIIGKNTIMAGSIELACLEGTSIKIGENCLFSSRIFFRTGDSHSILNLQGERLNPSKDIDIRNHVWLCQNVTVLKGVIIASDNIIGYGSIVSSNVLESNCIIAGAPAKIIKRDITWCYDKLTTYAKHIEN